MPLGLVDVQQSRDERSRGLPSLRPGKEMPVGPVKILQRLGIRWTFGLFRLRPGKRMPVGQVDVQPRRVRWSHGLPGLREGKQEPLEQADVARLP